MLKVKINAVKGKELKTPIYVFVNCTAFVDTKNDRLVARFTQSDTKDVLPDMAGVNSFDWIEAKKDMVIEEKPELPKTTKLLEAKADENVKLFIESLKLAHVVSIEKI